MVLFSNIKLNQEVEVLLHGFILKGKVKYKGFLNGIPGEWVGVDLVKPVGTNDGMMNARRYFQCRHKHGIFVTANKIRFIPMIRCLYNNYKTVEQDPIGPVDYELFSDENREDLLYDIDDYESLRTSRSSSRSEYPRSHTPSAFPLSHSFHLSHPIGNTLPPATMMRPETARRSAFGYRTQPVHTEYFDSPHEGFISAPSIPKTHMPHTALRRQSDRGWDSVSYAREMSVHTGRDSIRYDTWNCIL